jgi:NAD(P)H-dependent flavin oxidoreductase YrpB (nitropropane dioxygenase family)
MTTPVCELLGIEHPIVLAPMVAVPPLAAAVSNAGALGMVTLTWSEDIGAVVRETAALTARPFGGNFVLTEDHHRHLDQALEAGLRIVSFFLGDPSGYIEPVHDAGGIVMHTVGSAEEARRAVASGVDVVVAQGWEAGGHVWGTVATLPLVPAVVDAVAPVPVIAAGGIGGRDPGLPAVGRTVPRPRHHRGAARRPPGGPALHRAADHGHRGPMGQRVRDQLRRRAFQLGEHHGVLRRPRRP